MIFNIPIGSGKPVTFLGAPGETITYSGPESGTVVLNSSGVATKKIKTGTYTLSGSVSSASGVTRTGISVRPGATVTMWPTGARVVYWYGYLGTNDSGVKLSVTKTGAKDSTSSWSVTENTNSVYLYINDSGSTSDGGNSMIAKASLGTISLAPYSTLKVIVGDTSAWGGGNGSNWGWATSTDAATSFSSSNAASGTHTLDVSSNGSSVYLGIKIYTTTAVGSRRGASAYLNAIWLT